MSNAVAYGALDGKKRGFIRKVQGQRRVMGRGEYGHNISCISMKPSKCKEIR